MPEESRKSSLAYLALKQIQSIYHEDKKLADLSAEKRVLHRRLTVKPLVDALFAWTKQNQCRVSEKSKTGKGFAYLLNQEKYLRVFLEDGNVLLCREIYLCGSTHYESFTLIPKKIYKGDG